MARPLAVKKSYRSEKATLDLAGNSSGLLLRIYAGAGGRTAQMRVMLLFLLPYDNGRRTSAPSSLARGLGQLPCVSAPCWRRLQVRVFLRTDLELD